MFVTSHTTSALRPAVRYAHQIPSDFCGSISFTNLTRIESLINCLDKLYQFRDHNQVETFLRNHIYLVNLLLEALAKVKNCFGQDSQIALEVVRDPEDGDCKLFAFVLTALPVEEALALRDQLDDEWWLEASERGQGQLIIDVEFI